MTARFGSRLLRGAAAAGVLTCAFLTPGAVPVAAQQGWSSFSAVAEADGLRVSAVVPGGPVTDRVLDAGAPRAQALLDGLGTSTAFAAAPWPGELVANAPGLLAGPTGLPLPGYPFITTSSHPTVAKGSQSVGPILLTAASEELGSAAQGRMEPAAGLAAELDASATVTRTAQQTVTARAESSAQQLVLGPLVLGRVVAYASVSRSPGGPIVRESALSVTGAQIGDQALELTPTGFALAGTAVPVGPDHPALEALAGRGITVRWIAEVETINGVVSPAIDVSVTQPISLTGEGASTITYTLGQAAAMVGVGESLQADAPLLPPDVVDAPLPARDLPAPGSAAGSLVALPVPVVPPPAAAASAEQPTLQIGPAVAARRAAELWPSFYPPLAVAGALGVAAVLSLRRWGVKRVWAS